MKKLREHRFVLFVLFACVFYYVQYQYTVSSYDDDVYMFYIPDGKLNHAEALMDETIVSRPVETVSDILESNVHAYNNSNGRFIVHSIVQACCSFMTMEQFAILNTFVFAIFLFFLFELSLPQSKSLFQMAFLFSLFWLFVYKGGSFLGNRACTVNYMWCAVANLAFCYVFKKQNEKPATSFVLQLCLFFISLICGSLSESFSIGLAGALLLFALFNLKGMNKPMVVMIIGYCVGSAITVFAPGNFARAEGRVNGLSLNLTAVYQLLSSPIVFILALTFIIKLLRGTVSLKGFIKKNSLLVSAFFLLCFFMVFVAYNGKHQQTFTNVIALVLLSRLLVNSDSGSSRFLRVTTIGLFILVAFSYFPILQIRKQLHDAYYSAVNKAIKQNGGVLCDEDYERVLYKVRNNNMIRDHFILPYSIRKDFVSMRLTKGKNIHFIDKVVPFEMNNLKNQCQSSKEIVKNVFLADNNIAIYRSNEEIDLSKIVLMFKEKYAFFLERQSLSYGNPYEKVYHDGDYYYFFPNINQYSSIESIRIEGESI